jgi:competence protein ComGC
MNKGQFELIELTMLVVAISIMLIISYFMLTTRTSKIKGLVTEEHIYTSLGDTVISFYNTKISGTKRTLAQLLADRIVGNSENIYYGEGVGIINVDKQVTEFFDSYLDEKWNLTSVTLTNQLSFGHEIPKDVNRKITYQIIVPRPSLSSDVVILNLDTWLE